MNEGIYYLRLNGKVEGPYSIGQIYDLWAARKINSQTPFARFEEMDKWQPLAELTLKISAPRPSSTKVPEPETPAPTPPSPKPRVVPTVLPEERASAKLYRREPRPPSQPVWSTLATQLRKRVLFNFSLMSAVCVVAGILVALYFMAFLSAGSDGKELDPNLLIIRQTGVIAGIGLVLMGGLLIIARQITQILIAMKSDGWKNGNKGPPQ